MAFFRCWACSCKSYTAMYTYCQVAKAYGHEIVCLCLFVRTIEVDNSRDLTLQMSGLNKACTLFLSAAAKSNQRPGLRSLRHVFSMIKTVLKWVFRPGMWTHESVLHLSGRGESLSESTRVGEIFPRLPSRHSG